MFELLFKVDFVFEVVGAFSKSKIRSHFVKSYSDLSFESYFYTAVDFSVLSFQL